MNRSSLLAALALLTAHAVGCGLIDSPAKDSGATRVAVLRTDLTVDVVARGELEATSASPIAVPRVPTGALKVKELVEEGTIVEEGDIVVVFDDTALNIELDNHRASFRSADRRIDGTQLSATIESDSIQVMRTVAELERDNIQAFEIIDESIYSRQEILEDEIRLDTAEETIVFADASLMLRGEYYEIEERILDVEREQLSGKVERVEYSLGNLVLKAPIGGLIVYKKNWRGSSVAVGDTLWPGNLIVSIVDPDSTALKAFVLERDAAGLVEGAEATVRIDARPGHTFEGRIANISELSRPIDRGSPVKYFEVEIEITDNVETLKPGMKGEARIVTASLEDVVVAPRSAIRGPADAPFVIVHTAAGPERRDVVLGPGDLVRVCIAEGLESGEELLLGDDDAPGLALAAEPQGESAAGADGA